jgi:putative endonuclease
MVEHGSPTPPLASSGAIPFPHMHYVYLMKTLKSEKKRFYIGFSSDLKLRFRQHNNGDVEATRYGVPWLLIYYEAYSSKKLAEEREKKLKQFGSAYVGLLKRLGIDKFYNGGIVQW